jgi:pyrimidine-nucleoside phosphorylase
MLPAEVIERKRDGRDLSAGELAAFLEGFLSGSVADYQIAAFLMAVYYQGLSPEELEAFTRTIIESGACLDFRDGGPPAVDKHSTGGVGDKVSLILAPLLAEYGLRVPMMSGRGLGHTGGTLDKLESIPGFRTDLSLEEFKAVLGDVGCAMIGQTPEIAPLDGLLYSLRDVTATVPAMPLIAASIVSKKVAEGISALVLDVKFGRGAFLPDRYEAVRLAEIMVALSEHFGLPATALLTAMDEPLGSAVGNSLEVAEAISCLRGEGPVDLREVTIALSAEAVVGAGAAPASEAASRLADLLDSGAALDRFRLLTERQGGDPAVVDDPALLPRAPFISEFPAAGSGFVSRIDAREVGFAAVELGAGRRRAGDAVDPAVGFEVLVQVGERVSERQSLVRIHARSEEAAGRALDRLESAVALSDSPPAPAGPLVWKRVAAR